MADSIEDLLARIPSLTHDSKYLEDAQGLSSDLDSLAAQLKSHDEVKTFRQRKGCAIIFTCGQTLAHAQRHEHLALYIKLLAVVKIFAAEAITREQLATLSQTVRELCRNMWSQPESLQELFAFLMSWCFEGCLKNEAGEKQNIDLTRLDIGEKSCPLTLMLDTISIILQSVTKNESLQKLQRQCLDVLYLLGSFSLQLCAVLQDLARTVLNLVVETYEIDPSTHAVSHKVAAVILTLGVPDLRSVEQMYKEASRIPAILDLLMSAARYSNRPASIIFDLSTRGFASLEMAELPQPFPPSGPGSGYTIMMWLQIEQFDDVAHTTLFGVFNSSQTCFILLYVEKESHHLILQTSMQSSRPSVRFKSKAFEAGTWYHVAVVQKYSPDASSRAALFIDGEFCEQVQTLYPGHKETSRIQAFLGTPHVLAPAQSVHSCWCLASAQLISKVVSDDLLAVYYELGSRYTGNFQDCLGSFQTYEASARLNIRNESLYPLSTADRASPIVQAIRSKASTLLAEEDFRLNFAAEMIFTPARLNDSQASMYSARTTIAVNGASSMLDDASSAKSRHGVLYGGASVVKPVPLDDSIWCLAGTVPFCLGLVEQSVDPDALIRHLDLLFTCIRSSWRNSEAMEKEFGFVILSDMLKDLFAKFSSFNQTGSWKNRCLDQILDFVGVSQERKEDSAINNPLAYRVLLVDLSLWREDAGQKMYYDHIYDLAVQSKHHRFNLKRLARMRKVPTSLVEADPTGVIKKWLDDILYIEMDDDSMASYWRAIEALIPHTISSELLRSIAIFITYCLRTTFDPRSQRRTTVSSQISNDADSGKRKMVAVEQRMELGGKMLQVLVTIICRSEEAVLLKKFTKTVTEKWLLYLMASSNHSIVLSAWKLLAHTLLGLGPASAARFLEKSGGSDILCRRLRLFGTHPSVWGWCFKVLFHRGLSNPADLADFHAPELLLILQLDDRSEVIQTGMLSVMMEMLRATEDSKVFSFVVDTFSDLYRLVPVFRTFAQSSSLVAELFMTLYPRVVQVDPLPPAAELSSDLRHSDKAIIMQPLGETSSSRRPILNDLSAVDILVPAKSDVLGENILGLILTIFEDQILNRKDFNGLGLFMRVPPGSFEHQACFETFLLNRSLHRIMETLEKKSDLLSEPRVLTNLGRLTLHLVEAINERWYIDGISTSISFAAKILHALAAPELAAKKSVRLCSQNIAAIRTCMCRLLILQLSDSPNPDFLKTFSSHIPLLAEAANDLLSLLVFLLLELLPQYTIAINILRLMVIHHNETVYTSESVSNLFSKQPLRNLPVLEDHEFLQLYLNQRAIQDLMAGTLSSKWAQYTAFEQEKGHEIQKARRIRRREKLKGLDVEIQKSAQIFDRHNISRRNWLETMTKAETCRRQRLMQDELDNRDFNFGKWQRTRQTLDAPAARLHWRFDQTEGRSRTRIRLSPVVEELSRPKSTKVLPPKANIPKAEEYEMIQEPAIGDEEEEEDRHRKVLRSLQPGDPVENVYNISQMIGLEAFEGLLIMGRTHLYLVQGLCQRADGNLIYLDQASADERDPYLSLICDTSGKARASETRHWHWKEVLRVSKRRFLFRDVAIEVFFMDGQSCLFIALDAASSTAIYNRMLAKAPMLESNWRLEALPAAAPAKTSLTQRFGSVLTQTNAHVATAQWTKGEISNFHYLMLINTMAGRTFNDLTQYPVFPWVLADYCSEELDLSKRTSYRDLTKPMGCQDANREREFQSRYESFAGMGDQNAFHYGTHYSSAMIVASFLVRLPPFLQSFLLLQGGSFDHADRMFYSIAKAWQSASHGGMSDVRELIPEFFCLPEFLTNTNEYDLGARQGSGDRIDDVELPPWAKGDPHVFIARHREALESEYVTQNLPAWIDLVFGIKQRGEAAVIATNVFHHLSYHGAKNLDQIDDPMERAATIGIIHNFGQTPHQIFSRSHPSQNQTEGNAKRLDFEAESLTCLPFPKSGQACVRRLEWCRKRNIPVISTPHSLAMGPSFDIYMKYGFFDGSVRFFRTKSHQELALFEHVHVGRVTAAIFADGETLVTGSDDCTVSLWKVKAAPETVGIVPKRTLFGHRAPIVVLAVSRSLSVLLSGARDGQVRLWDINQQCPIRILTNKIVQLWGHFCYTIFGCEISLWTINGRLLVQQEIPIDRDDNITACAVFEGSGVEYLSRQLIFSGHTAGVVNVWNLTIFGKKFTLEHVKRMDHVDHNGHNVRAAITAILPRAQAVFTGDEHGHVYEWNLVLKH